MKHKFIALYLMAALAAGLYGDDSLVALVEKLVRPEFKMTCLVTTQKRPNKPLADSLRKEAAEKGIGLAVSHPELVEQYEKGEVITKRHVIEAAGPLDYKASITRVGGINDGWVWEYFATADTGLFERFPHALAETNATLPGHRFRMIAEGFPAACLTSYLGDVTRVEKVKQGNTTLIKAQWTPSQDHWLEIVLNEKETAISGLRVFLRGALSKESEVLEWAAAADGTPVPGKTFITQYDEKGDWRSKEIWDFEELSFEGIDPERFRYVAP